MIYTINAISSENCFFRLKFESWTHALCPKKRGCAKDTFSDFISPLRKINVCLSSTVVAVGTKIIFTHGKLVRQLVPMKSLAR